MSTLYSYCNQCGGRNEKSPSLKFCSSCGQPIGGNAVASIKKPPVKQFSRARDDEDEEDEIIEIPELEKLEVELGQRRSKLTIRDFANGQVAEGYIRDKQKTVSKKKFLEDWQRIAGPRQKGESTEVGGGD